MRTHGKNWAAALTSLAILAVLGTAGVGAVRAQEIHGFVEGLAGARTAEGDGFDAGSYTAEETRIQLRVSDYGNVAEYFTRIDFAIDQVTGESDDQVTGEAELEVREAFITYTGIASMDFKFGRQIATWGTGDLMFINDVFAKDWESFFVGREDQYLKAPHDALRIGMYPGGWSVNLLLIPSFEPDRLPTAERMAFYDPFMGQAPLRAPEERIDDGELALRLQRSLGRYELALYGYRGFFRQPVGARAIGPDPQDPPEIFYPRLNVYGASLRGGMLGGVANLEAGLYDSRRDGEGDNPMIENSTLRWMGGFDRQIATDTQLGLQAYFEKMLDHAAYVAALPAGFPEKDELRQIYTLRLTRMFKYQTIMWSLFGFVSPSDEDYYLRSSLSYDLTDHLKVVAGANLFGGDSETTMFGQFEFNDNVYVRARYSF